jgi:hypothetical protein
MESAQARLAEAFRIVAWRMSDERLRILREQLRASSAGCG